MPAPPQRVHRRDVVTGLAESTTAEKWKEKVHEMLVLKEVTQAQTGRGCLPERSGGFTLTNTLPFPVLALPCENCLGPREDTVRLPPAPSPWKGKKPCKAWEPKQALHQGGHNEQPTIDQGPWLPVLCQADISTEISLKVELAVSDVQTE